MAPVRVQRLVGLIFCVACILGFQWFWQTYIDEGIIYIKVAFLLPIFMAVGLGMIFFPVKREEMQAKWGVEKLEKYEHIPKVWWAILGIGFGAGVLLIFLMKSGILYQFLIG